MTTNGRTPTLTKPAPILDLDDLVEPGATWIFQGVEYEYLRWSSLGMLERKRLDNLHRRIQELEELEEPTDEDEAAYDVAVREMVIASTPGAPIEVVDEMTSEARGNVATYFLALRLARTTDMRERKLSAVRDWIEATTPATAPTPSETSAPTPSASSSPDSIDSGRKPTRASGSKSLTRSSRRTNGRSSS